MRMPLYNDGDKERPLFNKEVSFRTPFRRDNGRLIHCPAFRRLQGKTQLFPGYESDFFRNRLTHSLEVAQIAKGIAEYLNDNFRDFKKFPIDLDLVETAALAHDLGHPPFGHNGEKALDDCMKECGGFEGNAQTLRILAKLEKKYTYQEGFTPILKQDQDNRCGLNFTYRTLASILKYDNKIHLCRAADKKVDKGYYYTESDLVDKIKEKVLSGYEVDKFKTIECQIMDIADDISYSTYDLEDAFKAEFLSPITIWSADDNLLEKVVQKINKHMERTDITITKVRQILREIFPLSDLPRKLIESLEGHDITLENTVLLCELHYSVLSNKTIRNAYFRTSQTSNLVKKFMKEVEVKYNNNCPAMSKIYLKDHVRFAVEVLKHFTYEAVIMSPRLKIVEFRGYDVVKDIFNAINSTDGKYYGPNLLPDDHRELYDSFQDNALKKRVICDFIAGMTDRYAVEFYGRLKSENPQSIFKPF